jgi:hypothetical protein
VAQLLAMFDPTLVFLVLVPAALFISAWALQMACAFAAVEPPDYWQSLLCMFLVVVANVLLRFWVNVSILEPGLGSQVLGPLVMTAGIIAIIVRTGPFSALMVTICEGGICAVLFVGFSMLMSAVM